MLYCSRGGQTLGCSPGGDRKSPATVADDKAEALAKEIGIKPRTARHRLQTAEKLTPHPGFAVGRWRPDPLSPGTPCSPTVTKSSRIFALLRPLRTKLIKCHFLVGSEPLWAWVCSVLDRQDAINELMN